MVPQHVDTGLPPSAVGLVHDVIVNEGRWVNHLRDHGHLPLRRQQSTVQYKNGRVTKMAAPHTLRDPPGPSADCRQMVRALSRCKSASGCTRENGI